MKNGFKYFPHWKVAFHSPTWFASVLLFTFLLGCGSEQSQHKISDEDSGSQVENVVDTKVAVPLREGSPLARVAQAARKESVRTSTSVFDIQRGYAAQQEIRSDWLPRPEPIATISHEGNAAFGLALRQKVWDFNESGHQIKRTEAEIQLATMEHWREQNDGVFQALDSYLDVVSESRQIEELDRLLGVLETLQSSASERLSGGVGNRRDLLEIEASFQRATRERLEAVAENTAAQARLNRALGAFADGTIVPAYSPEDAVADCNMAQNSPTSPEIKIAAFRVDVTQAQMDVLSSQRFPTVIANVAATNDFGGTTDTTAFVGLDASRLLGWNSKPQLVSAQNALDQAEQDYRNTVEDGTLAREQVQTEYAQGLSTVQAMKRLIENSTETLTAFRDQFRAGRADITDGSQLEQEYSESYRTLISAQISLAKNCLRMARLNGSLAPYSTEVAR